MLLNDDQNYVTAAVDWASQNPGVLMPDIPLWARYFGKDSSAKPVDLCNGMDTVKHGHVAPQIIPFLVAVNLGRPLDEIASVIKHHGITTHHLKEISFKSSDDFTLVYGKPWMPIIDVHLAFFKACDLDQDLADRIEAARIHYCYSEDVSIALLHTRNQKSWLSTRLESGTDNAKEKAEELVHSMPKTHKLADPKFWPNGDFGQLLERCGAFHERILNGNPQRDADELDGFWAQLIYESTFRMEAQEITSFFKLVTRLLESEYSKSVARALRTLDGGGYNKTQFELIDSLTRTAEEQGVLDALPIELILAATPGERRASSFGEGYRSWASSGVFKTIADAPDQFFKKAIDQFIDIPVSELGWFEQRAIWKLPRLGMPAQDLSGVDLEILMTHSFSVIKALPRVDEYRAQVIDAQIDLVKYLENSCAISQPYLDSLNQEDLEVFVRAGVAPQMRKNLSITALSRTFSDDLGI